VTDDAAPSCEALRAAWREAARDLEIRVSTEDSWLLDADGRRHAVVAVVHDFGNRRGTAIFGIEDFSRAQMDASELPENEGLYSSWLGDSYETYDRELFVDTLNDWRWFGEGEPPSWYTGALDHRP
jgi:hypothetical protein